MAASTVHVLHGILNSSTFLSQITNARPVTNIENFTPQAAGLPFPLFTADMATAPAVEFDITQLKTVLDLSGALESIVDLSATNTDLHFKKVTDLGRRLADASTGHLRFRMSQACLVVDSITANNSGEASAKCKLLTTYDGSNAPLVPAGSLALAGTPSSATHWTVGPVYLNTVNLPGVEEVNIELNKQLVIIRADGELYPTFIGLLFYSPVVTIRGYEHVWATYGLNGTALTAGSFYLRKIAEDGTRVADGTAEHIKFAATSGIITVEESGGGNNEPSMTTLRCNLTGASETTEPITVNTAIAITS